MSAQSCEQLCPITADHMRAGNWHSSEGTRTLIISASQYHLSVHISATQSVSISAAYQCRLTVPVSAAYQCRLSVPYMSAAFQ
ncbi:unnamed protein product [Staurois parvus]|uniref:Uncharacterized protein n=1 Tax=Staurois parvus TaxID=386267 RepID=A0ABN9H1H9_9NEOB|nr:unnamed protein product [Staurois parvus]